jgi:hypothetical protein
MMGGVNLSGNKGMCLDHSPHILPCTQHHIPQELSLKIDRSKISSFHIFSQKIRACAWIVLHTSTSSFPFLLKKMSGYDITLDFY